MKASKIFSNQIFVIVVRRLLLLLATLGLVVAALAGPEALRAPAAVAALAVFVFYVVYYIRTRRRLKQAMLPADLATASAQGTNAPRVPQLLPGQTHPTI